MSWLHWSKVGHLNLEAKQASIWNYLFLEMPNIFHVMMRMVIAGGPFMVGPIKWICHSTKLFPGPQFRPCQCINHRHYQKILQIVVGLPMPFPEREGIEVGSQSTRLWTPSKLEKMQPVFSGAQVAAHKSTAIEMKNGMAHLNDRARTVTFLTLSNSGKVGLFLACLSHRGFCRNKLTFWGVLLRAVRCSDKTQAESGILGEDSVFPPCCVGNMKF